MWKVEAPGIEEADAWMDTSTLWGCGRASLRLGPDSSRNAM